jgi:hypothetical protein
MSGARRLDALCQRLIDPDGFDRAALATIEGPTHTDQKAACDTVTMREGATLKLDTGEELRVEFDRDDLEREEIVVRRGAEPTRSREELLKWIDHHLATAKRHPAGTTDRFLQADRERPY